MKKITFLILGIMIPLGLQAGAEEDIQLLRDNLAKEMSEVPVSEVKATPINGLYQVNAGSRVFYMTPDLKYAFRGSIIDLANMVDMTSMEQGKLSMAAISKIPENRMVVFEPKDRAAERSITVFTDTSCPFCAKLHLEVPALLEAGVKVRYMLYPRAGLGSPAYTALQSIWCAEDQQQAMTDTKAGKQIEQKACENPIAEHIELAREVGLTGTPLILTDAGEKISGYRPASALLDALKATKPL